MSCRHIVMDLLVDLLILRGAQKLLQNLSKNIADIFLEAFVYIYLKRQLGRKYLCLCV